MVQFTIIGTTPAGRATVTALQVNRPRMMETRESLTE